MKDTKTHGLVLMEMIQTGDRVFQGQNKAILMMKEQKQGTSLRIVHYGMQMIQGTSLGLLNHGELMVKGMLISGVVKTRISHRS